MTNSHSSTDKSIDIKSSDSKGYVHTSLASKGLKLESFKKMIAQLKKDFTHPFLTSSIDSLLYNELLQKKALEINEFQKLCNDLRNTQEKCIIFLSQNVPNLINPIDIAGVKILFSWIDELYCLNSKYNFDSTIEKMSEALLDSFLISDKLQNLKTFAILAYIYKIHPNKEKINNAICIYIDIILLAHELLQKIEYVEFKKIAYNFINVGLFFLIEIKLVVKIILLMQLLM